MGLSVSSREQSELYHGTFKIKIPMGPATFCASETSGFIVLLKIKPQWFLKIPSTNETRYISTSKTQT